MYIEEMFHAHQKQSLPEAATFSGSYHTVMWCDSSKTVKIFNMRSRLVEMYLMPTGKIGLSFFVSASKGWEEVITFLRQLFLPKRLFLQCKMLLKSITAGVHMQNNGILDTILFKEFDSPFSAIQFLNMTLKVLTILTTV